jgi:putative ABC transport system ATP-binding protein
MIRVSDLDFAYGEGEFHLRIPSLHIEAGEKVAVIGPSGSGKTTLLQLVAGIATARGGAIHTCGVEVTALDDAARRDFRIQRLGLVFQEFALIDYLSVIDNLLLPYRIHPSLQLDAEVRERAAGVAARLGIGAECERLASCLSQGERQRVAIGRALVVEPELLLADEPTGNLDPDNTDRVLDILCDYAAESGATLLTVTHDRQILHRFSRLIDFEDLTREGRAAGEVGR